MESLGQGRGVYSFSRAAKTAPQTAWLKQQKLTVAGSGGKKSGTRSRRGGFLLRAVREGSVPDLSPSFW